jgi:hypothetical protein
MTKQTLTSYLFRRGFRLSSKHYLNRRCAWSVNFWYDFRPHSAMRTAHACSSGFQPNNPYVPIATIWRNLISGSYLYLVYRTGKEACDICYRGMCYLAHIVPNTIQLVRGVHDNWVSGYNACHDGVVFFFFLSVNIAAARCSLSTTFFQFMYFFQIWEHFLNLWTFFNSWCFLKFMIFFQIHELLNDMFFPNHQTFFQFMYFFQIWEHFKIS